MSTSWLHLDIALHDIALHDIVLRGLNPHRKLRSVDQGGYPDCFFLCVKSQLKLEESVQEMRQKLSEYVGQNPPDKLTLETVFEEIFSLQPHLIHNPSDQLLETYLTWLKADLCASDIEINATCAVYNAHFVLYTLDQNRNISYQQHGDRQNLNYIALAYHGNHYRTVESFRSQVNPFDLYTTSGERECALESMLCKDVLDTDVINSRCSYNYGCGDLFDNSNPIFICHQDGCFEWVHFHCICQGYEGFRCNKCRNIFYYFCKNHSSKCIGSSHVCNGCTVNEMKFSSLSLDENTKLTSTKEEIHQKLYINNSLVTSTFTSRQATLVSMNIKGRTGKVNVGNPQRRRIIGEAFLTACQADIVLFQDSDWVPAMVVTHFNAVFPTRNYVAVGTMRTAFVVYDAKKYNILACNPADLVYGVPDDAFFDVVGRNLRDRSTRKEIQDQAIRDTFLRLSVAPLEDLETGKRIVVASYHGPYKCAEQVSKSCGAWAHTVIAAYAALFNCQFIIGGDYNCDIEDLVPVLPTHSHDPFRANNFDWIIPSSHTLLFGHVKYCAIFPLPLVDQPINGVVGDDPSIEIYSPWDEGRHVLLDLILERENVTIEWLHMTPRNNLFDHSPMMVYFIL